MSIRMIALDLDGTTLNSAGKLTEKTKRALMKAVDMGIEIVPATGRCFKSLPLELTELSGGRCIHYAVTSNGAEIRAARTGEILYGNYIGLSGIGEIKKILHKREIMVEIYVKGSAYIEQAYYEKVETGRLPYRSRDYVLETRVPVRGVIHLLDVHQTQIEKVAVYFDENAPQSRLKEEVSELEHVHMTSSGKNNVELIARSCSKAEALKALCGRLGISLDEVMAMGDSRNDIEMLEAAGLSVAMGNAEEEVKRRVDFVTASNDRDGVAEAIEKKCIRVYTAL